MCFGVCFWVCCWVCLWVYFGVCALGVFCGAVVLVVAWCCVVAVWWCGGCVVVSLFCVVFGVVVVGVCLVVGLLGCCCGGVCAVLLCVALGWCFACVFGFVFGLFWGWSLELNGLLSYMVSGNGLLTWSLELVAATPGLLSYVGLRGCWSTGAK